MANYAPAGKLPEIIEAFEKVKKASSKAEIVGLINAFDLPREAIPTRWLNELDAGLYATFRKVEPVSRHGVGMLLALVTAAAAIYSKLVLAPILDASHFS